MTGRARTARSATAASRVPAPLERATAQGVWLTFDDGPTPGVTDRILDVLREHGATATFFVCGAFAEQHPELLRRTARDGHGLGNHSWSHRVLPRSSVSSVRSELARTNAVIAAATGEPPRYFRPPYGDYDRHILATASALGLRTVLWSISPEDWECPGRDAIVERVVRKLEPGSIVLLHDGCANALAPFPGQWRAPADRDQTVESLPDILKALQARHLKTLRSHDG